MGPFSFMAGIATVMGGKASAAEARRAEGIGFGHLAQGLAGLDALSGGEPMF